MLKLLLSRNQNTLTEAILSRCVELSREGQVLLLVPEQYSHEMERKLCQLGGDAVSSRAEVLSFSRLAQRVFQELGGSARPVLDKGGRVLLMHLALKRLVPQLRVYRRSGTKAGFLTSLISTVDECKSYRITPELLIQAGEENDTTTGERLHELGLIFSAYDAMVQQRAEDPRDRLTRLADILRGTDYFKGKHVLLDCFTDLTPQERLVVSVILRQSPSVTAALGCDGLELAGDAVFAPTRRTALALTALARDSGVGMEYRVLEESRPDSELAFLGRELFSNAGVTWEDTVDQVYMCKEKTPYSEAERVAEEILSLVRDRDLRFRDITVAVRDLTEWQDRMEAVFGRYGIPIFLSRKDDILQKPVLALITAALDTISRGYEPEDLFRYLKTGLTGVDREDVDALENYTLIWEIRGSRWTTEKEWSWHPAGYGQSWTDGDREELARLNALRLDLVAPLEQLRRSGAETGRDWAMAVYDFLERIDLVSCLQTRAEELLAAGSVQQAQEYRQVWQVLVNALEQCADLLGEDKLSLSDFCDLFRLVLSQYQVGSIPVSLDRVTCSDMARISHGTNRVLFLLGCDDEHLPQVNQDTGLLTEEDRRLLSALGAETALNADQRLDREMLLIYECCTYPTQALYVSYATHGLDGSEKRPSFLIHRLEELFPLGAKDYVNYKIPSSLAPALDYASAQGDLAALEGLSVIPGGEQAAMAIAAMGERREDLSAQAVAELYRGKVRLSASRMDQVKSCHYGYFLQYGIKVKKRKVAGLDAPEAGTFVHFVLETVLTQAKELGGVDKLSDEDVTSMARQATEEYIATTMGGMEDKTPRFRYLFRRLAKSAEQVVWQMVEELKASDFAPVAFELGFGNGEDLPPVRLNVDGIEVSVSGFVDRVDGWVHEGKLYLRVVDYKTGKKAFDLTDVWHGLNLQMLLYLFTLEEKGLPGDNHPIVPAGVLYLPAREEQLSGARTMDEEHRRQALDKKLRRSGLILNDPNVIDAMEHIPLGSEARFLPVRVSKRTGAISGDSLASAVQLGKLRKHIHRILRDIAREVGGGNIQADPWFRDDMRTACRWCDYVGACHFEEGRCGERSRYLYPVKGTDFWEQVDEDEQEGGRG